MYHIISRHSQIEKDNSTVYLEAVPDPFTRLPPLEPLSSIPALPPVTFEELMTRDEGVSRQLDHLLPNCVRLKGEEYRSSYRAIAKEEKIWTEEQLSAVSSFLSIHKVSETLEKKLTYARTFSFEAAIEENFLKRFEIPLDLWKSLQSIAEEGGAERYLRNQQLLHEAGVHTRRHIHEIESHLLQDEREDLTLKEKLLCLNTSKLFSSSSPSSSSDSSLAPAFILETDSISLSSLVLQVLETIDDPLVRDLLLSFKASLAKYKSKAEQACSANHSLEEKLRKALRFPLLSHPSSSSSSVSSSPYQRQSNSTTSLSSSSSPSLLFLHASSSSSPSQAFMEYTQSLSITKQRTSFSPSTFSSSSSGLSPEGMFSSSSSLHGKTSSPSAPSLLLSSSSSSLFFSSSSSSSSSCRSTPPTVSASPVVSLQDALEHAKDRMHFKKFLFKSIQVYRGLLRRLREEKEEDEGRIEGEGGEEEEEEEESEGEKKARSGDEIKKAFLHALIAANEAVEDLNRKVKILKEEQELLQNENSIELDGLHTRLLQARSEGEALDEVLQREKAQHLRPIQERLSAARREVQRQLGVLKSSWLSDIPSAEQIFKAMLEKDEEEYYDIGLGILYCLRLGIDILIQLRREEEEGTQFFRQLSQFLKLLSAQIQAWRRRRLGGGDEREGEERRKRLLNFLSIQEELGKKEKEKKDKDEEKKNIMIKKEEDERERKREKDDRIEALEDMERKEKRQDESSCSFSSSLSHVKKAIDATPRDLEEKKSQKNEEMYKDKKSKEHISGRSSDRIQLREDKEEEEEERRRRIIKDFLNHSSPLSPEETEVPRVHGEGRSVVVETSRSTSPRETQRLEENALRSSSSSPPKATDRKDLRSHSPSFSSKAKVTHEKSKKTENKEEEEERDPQHIKNRSSACSSGVRTPQQHPHHNLRSFSSSSSFSYENEIRRREHREQEEREEHLYKNEEVRMRFLLSKPSSYNSLPRQHCLLSDDRFAHDPVSSKDRVFLHPFERKEEDGVHRHLNLHSEEKEKEDEDQRYLPTLSKTVAGKEEAYLPHRNRWSTHSQDSMKSLIDRLLEKDRRSEDDDPFIIFLPPSELCLAHDKPDEEKKEEGRREEERVLTPSMNPILLEKGMNEVYVHRDSSTPPNLLSFEHVHGNSSSNSSSSSHNDSHDLEKEKNTHPYHREIDDYEGPTTAATALLTEIEEEEEDEVTPSINEEGEGDSVSKGMSLDGTKTDMGSTLAKKMNSMERGEGEEKERQLRENTKLEEKDTKKPADARKEGAIYERDSYPLDREVEKEDEKDNDHDDDRVVGEESMRVIDSWRMRIEGDASSRHRYQPTGGGEDRFKTSHPVSTSTANHRLSPPPCYTTTAGTTPTTGGGGVCTPEDFQRGKHQPLQQEEEEHDFYPYRRDLDQQREEERRVFFQEHLRASGFFF
ncbi:bro1-like domain protein [Cystoisospora suis]|uniref:Bro1-like domain protein n=1 Tax=Cystoisospora suis TaxID=483139 RepID=A0A2C6L2P5_9APIC|nr:bro1-like domain protein [Cystoisospora suis]